MSPKMLNILLVLIPAFLYYGFYKPLINGTPGIVWTPEATIGSLQNQNVMYANALSQIDTIELGIKKINDDYLAVSQADIEKINLMLPDSIDKIRLHNEVVAIADKEGVALGAVSISNDTANRGKDVGSYIVSFSLRAKYSVFKRVMEAYEKNQRFYIIDTISIKHPADGDIVPGGAVFDKEALIIRVSFKVHFLM